MNKTSDTASDVAATSEPELTAAELETVTGGRLLLRLKVPDYRALEDRAASEFLKMTRSVLDSQ
jgi:hypothetical protein